MDFKKDFEEVSRPFLEVYQPKKKWTIKAQVALARRTRLGKYAIMGTPSRTQEGYGPQR